MTPYSNVYELFLSKIEDDSIKDKFKNNTELALYMLNTFLKSAISKFTYSTKDLTQRDDSLSIFTIDLSELEQEILARWMVVEYLSPKIIREEFLEEKLGSKDYQWFSPANHLKELRETRKSFEYEANELMLEYYYRQGI